MIRSARRLAGLALVLLLATAAAPASAQPLPCADALITTLEEVLSSLRALGLPAPLANGLQATLRAAIAAADRGNIPAALGILGATENQVRALVRSGRLDPVTGDTLIGLIEQARAVLGNCTATPPLAALTSRSGNAENRLFWLSPSPTASTTILYRTDRYPSGPADPGAVLLGTFATGPDRIGSASHPALTNGERVYYAAYSDDGSGELSPGRLTWGRPQDDAAGFAWSARSAAPALRRGRARPGAWMTLSSLGFLFSLVRVKAVAPGVGFAPVPLSAPAPIRPGTALDSVFVPTSKGGCTPSPPRRRVPSDDSTARRGCAPPCARCSGRSAGRTTWR
jgi:hypothetical protein